MVIGREKEKKKKKKKKDEVPTNNVQRVKG